MLIFVYNQRLSKTMIRHLFFIAMLILLQTSCEKMVTEQGLVFDYEHISIPAVENINAVSFPTKTTGYASTSSGLYKTEDSGRTWTLIHPTTPKHIHFHTVDFGITDRGSYTFDGGLTWENFGVSCKGATISEKGEIVLLTKQAVNVSAVWKAEPFETELQFIDYLVGIYFSDVEYGQAVNGSAYFYSSGNDGDLIGMNLSTGAQRTIYIGYKMNAFCLLPDEAMVCGQDGNIARGSITKDYSDVERRYHEHNYEYLAMDAKDGVFVAVGFHSIASNKKLEIDSYSANINEVLDIHESSFNETFKLVDVIDANNMVIVTSTNRIYIGNL